MEEAGRALGKTVGAVYAARSRVMRRLKDEIQQSGFVGRGLKMPKEHSHCDPGRIEQLLEGRLTADEQSQFERSSGGLPDVPRPA